MPCKRISSIKLLETKKHRRRFGLPVIKRSKGKGETVRDMVKDNKRYKDGQRQSITVIESMTELKKKKKKEGIHVPGEPQGLQTYCRGINDARSDPKLVYKDTHTHTHAGVFSFIRFLCCARG